MSMAFLMFGSIEEMGYDRNSYYIYKKIKSLIIILIIATIILGEIILLIVFSFYINRLKLI